MGNVLPTSLHIAAQLVFNELFVSHGEHCGIVVQSQKETTNDSYFQCNR